MTPAPPLSAADMPRIEGIDVPRELHVVSRAPLLGGMPRASRRHAARLHAAGFRNVVALVPGGGAEDVAPLGLVTIPLQDLHLGHPPDDPAAELVRVQDAIDRVLELLPLGGVVVHCFAGIGRTGTVLGGALVRLGHDPAEVIAHLDALHRERGVGGWPECAWQAEAIRAIAGSAQPPSAPGPGRFDEDAFGATVFVLDRGGEAERLAEELARDGFGIVTAWNPGGILPRELNDAAHRRLVAEVRRRGLRHAELEGASPDLAHRELSLLIDAPRPAILELGRTFFQRAVFFVSAGELHLLSCDHPVVETPLGPFASRQRSR